MPEQAPFTAVLKYAAEEVRAVALVEALRTVYQCTGASADMPVLGQFKVPAQTSAIITNGALVGTGVCSTFVYMQSFITVD